MISCTKCGSPDWLRCDPGQSSEFERHQHQLVLPVGDERPVVAWCLVCDPLVRRGG